MKKISFFFQKLLLPETDLEKTPSRPYYKTQRKNLKAIWNNEEYNDFGIERVSRILLQSLAFIIPSGILRSITGTANFLIRRLNIEFLVIVKLLFFYTVLKLDLTSSLPIVIIAIISTIDTLHFAISRILLNDLYRKHVSYSRSLMLTFINYLEICLFFALIYAYLDNTIVNAFTINCSLLNANAHLSSIQAIYFSFVTAATIGYGDITPHNPFVMKVVIIQIIISLFFVIVFLTNIINQLGKNTFYNQKQNQKE